MCASQETQGDRLLRPATEFSDHVTGRDTTLCQQGQQVVDHICRLLDDPGGVIAGFMILGRDQRLRCFFHEFAPGEIGSGGGQRRGV